MDARGRVIVSNSIALHARLAEITRRIRKVEPRTRACGVRPWDETRTPGESSGARHPKMCNFEQIDCPRPMLIFPMASSATRSVAIKVPRPPKRTKSRSRVFDVKAFLDSTGLGRKVAKFARKESIFAQGDVAKHVMYIQEGGVKLSVVNQVGKEAVVAILGPGDFFGEACLGGQSLCMATATTIAPTTALVIDKKEMIRVLHEEHEFSDRFIAYMLARNIRVEEDLIDQLFNSSEKRLARTLLLLARYGAPGDPRKSLPKVSQETLAEMIGTTRSRVNFFMNKFRNLGFIHYTNRKIHIDNSLLSVVLHD
jgi:CRP/FNR family cyclic AMP-dependent transcriptional regulator